MWLVEVVLLPVAALATTLGAFAVRAGSRERFLIVRWLAFGLIDLWLWLVAIVAPLGPHLILVIALLVAHVVLALDLVRSSTGFAVRTRRGLGPGAGRYQSQKARRGYSGYRAD